MKYPETLQGMAVPSYHLHVVGMTMWFGISKITCSQTRRLAWRTIWNVTSSTMFDQSLDIWIGFIFFHRSRYVCFSIVFLNDQLRTVSSAAQHLDTNYWNSLNMSPSNMSQTIGAALQITHRCQSSLDINRSNLPCWFILTGIGWFWMILVDFEIFHFSCPLHHSSPRGGH